MKKSIINFAIGFSTIFIVEYFLFATLISNYNLFEWATEIKTLFYSVSITAGIVCGIVMILFKKR